jgi:membrane glycosyltransferase
LATVADSNDFNRFRLIVNQVKHTIIADADAIAVVSVQLLDAVRTRILFQFKKLSCDSLMNFIGKSVEFLLGASFEDDRLGHATLFRFARSQIRAQRATAFAAPLFDDSHVEHVFAELAVSHKTFNNRVAFPGFQTAKRGVNCICSLSDFVCHIKTLVVSDADFNVKSNHHQPPNRRDKTRRLGLG